MGELAVIAAALPLAAVAAVAALLNGAGQARIRRRVAAVAAGHRLVTSREASPPARLPGFLAAALRAAGLRPPSTAVVATVGAMWAAAMAAALWWAGPVGAVVAAAVSVVLPAVALDGRRRAAAQRYEAELPAFLDATARGLRSGATVPDAIAEGRAGLGSGLRADLDRLAVRLRRGVGLDGAFAEWVADRPVPAVRFAVAALSVGASSGGLTAAVVEQVASTIRVRLAARADARAAAGQARASAAVMVAAPVGFLALLAGGDSAAWEFLVGTPLGAACLIGGLALDAGAALVMARLVRSVAS